MLVQVLGAMGLGSGVVSGQPERQPSWVMPEVCRQVHTCMAHVQVCHIRVLIICVLGSMKSACGFGHVGSMINQHKDCGMTVVAAVLSAAVGARTGVNRMSVHTS